MTLNIPHKANKTPCKFDIFISIKKVFQLLHTKFHIFITLEKMFQLLHITQFEIFIPIKEMSWLLQNFELINTVVEEPIL